MRGQGRRSTRLTVGAIWVIAVAQPVAATPPEGVTLPDVVYTAGAPIPTSLNPGDVIRDAQSLTLTAPLPGHGVYVEALSEDGGSHFGLETEPNGNVIVSGWGSDGDSVQTGGGGINGPPACGDDAFNLAVEEGLGGEEYKVYGTFHWWFKLNSEPSYLTQSEAVGAIIDATSNITAQNDNCGLADEVSAVGAYLGTQTRSANIQPEGIGCSNTPDGYSMTTFGSITSDTVTLAVTCHWTDEHTGRDALVESDARIDASGRVWTVTPNASNCDGDWSLEAVMTHERGHTYGLAHVTDSAHPNLTMSGKLNGQCQNAESTLGLGDVLGLRQLY